jgi:hypothetical protein
MMPRVALETVSPENEFVRDGKRYVAEVSKSPLCVGCAFGGWGHQCVDTLIGEPACSSIERDDKQNVIFKLKHA